VVEAGFIKYVNTEVFRLTVGLGHLKECIDFSDCRDVVGDKRLDLGFQVNLLGLVTLNVLEHLLKLLCNGKVSVLVWVISTWNFLLIFIVFIFFCLLLSLLLHLLLSDLSLFDLGLIVHVDVDLVFFFL